MSVHAIACNRVPLHIRLFRRGARGRLLCFILAFAGQRASAQPSYNLDFEIRDALTPSMPWGWSAWLNPDIPGDEVGLDSTVRHHGRQSFRISRSVASPLTHRLGKSIDPSAVAGKRLRFSGWVRTQDLEGGHAGLAVQANGRKGLRIDTLGARVTGTSPWRHYVTEIVVDSATGSAQFWLSVGGTGTVWFDDLKVEIDGRSHLVEPMSQRPISAAEVQWLRRAAIPLDHARGTTEFSDLALLRPLLADARLIALGEATHGTKEFFEMKHRLVSFAAETLGVTIVAIEANQLEAERVNHYVRTGSGTAGEAMSGMFQFWRTREMLSFIEWVRDYNVRGGTLEFVGFDMQDPRLPVDSVKSFLARTDPGYVAVAESAYASMHATWQQQEFPVASMEMRLEWQRRARHVLNYLLEHRAEYLSRADSGEVSWAIQNATVALQAASLGVGRFLRDSAMAENLEWLLARRPPGARVVIWAHNGHIARRTSAMGHFIDRKFGSAYRPVALTTYEGSYNTSQSPIGSPQWHYEASPLVPSPPGSIEAILHGFRMPRLALDLRQARTDSLARSLLETRWTRSAGTWAVAEWHFWRMSLAPTYDVLLFIDKTRPSTILPCPPKHRCPVL